jgi:hypothetical protein
MCNLDAFILLHSVRVNTFAPELKFRNSPAGEDGCLNLRRGYFDLHNTNSTNVPSFLG